MSASPVRLALIGLGKMGMEHLEIFASLDSLGQISALADSHVPFAERAAARLPNAEVFHNPLDCVNNADIDAVVVATADETHFEIVRACIARGLFVLCEKPLTTSAEQSLQLVDAEAGRRLVQVGFMRRFDASYQRLHQAIHRGNVGEPVLIGQRHHNPLAVIQFDEHELITSSASHDIDVFRWLCGEDVREVSAITKTSEDGCTVTVVLTLTSQSGVLGVVELARGPGLNYEISCDLLGSRGAMRLASPARTDRVSDDGENDMAQLQPGAWMERFRQAYRCQDAAWLSAVAAGSSTGAGAYDGYATNTVIDAALAALTSDRAQSVKQKMDSTQPGSA